MTYRPIASTETDPDSPVTATLMVALAENHLAVTQLESTAIDEGEVNGAQFYQHALVTTPGDTDAKIYDQAIDGTVATVQFNLGTDKLLSFEYEIVFIKVSPSATNSTQFRFFKETSAAWTAWQTLGLQNANLTQFNSGKTRFSILPESAIIHGSSESARNDATNITPYLASTWDMTAVQNVTLCEIRFLTGNIDAGQIYAYKRQTYVGRE